jgi:hypothetical protein
MGADGRFLVVWHSDGSDNGDSSGWSIQGQLYDSTGLPLGAQFPVNSFVTGDQLFPSASFDPAGGFLVVSMQATMTWSAL